MAIKDFQTPTLSDHEARQRALANITKEFHTRFIGDSEEAGRAYLKTMGLTPSDAEVRTAGEKRDRAKYDEIKASNPFAAADFAARNPHVHKHGEDRVNTALNSARTRAIGVQSPPAANPFARAGERLHAAPTAPAPTVTVTPGEVSR